MLDNQLYKLLINEIEYFNYGTFGSLWIWKLKDNSFPKKFKCLTIPTNKDKAIFGDIPQGSHIIKWNWMNDAGCMHYRFENIIGHNSIFIHKGNTAADTKGCILVGEKMIQPDIRGQWQLENSSYACNAVELYLNKLDSEILIFP